MLDGDPIAALTSHLGIEITVELLKLVLLFILLVCCHDEDVLLLLQLMDRSQNIH
jgi:hypothetical protein